MLLGGVTYPRVTSLIHSARQGYAPAQALQASSCAAPTSSPKPTIPCSVQAERCAAGVKRFDFDAGLGPYDLHRFAQWQRLAGFISDGEKCLKAASRGGSIYVIFSPLSAACCPILGVRGAQNLASSILQLVKICSTLYELPGSHPAARMRHDSAQLMGACTLLICSLSHIATHPQQSDRRLCPALQMSYAGCSPCPTATCA